MHNTSNINKSSERIAWVDAFRGFLIILVVLGHVLQTGNFDNNRLWNFIYSFHMPAFFVISGYVSYKISYDERLYVKRIKGLLIPWVSWVFLFGLFSNNLNDYVWKAFYEPDTSLWFLITLFYIACFQNALYFLSQKININLFILSFISFVILLLVHKTIEPSPFGFGWTVYHFPYYVIGQYLRYAKFELIQNRLFYILLPVFFILAFYWKRLEVPIILPNLFIAQEYIIYFYKYACAITGSLALLYIFKTLSIFFSKRNLFVYAGQLSLGIYACHVPIIKFIRGWELGYSLCFVLTIFFSLLFVFCISKSSVLSRFFLGK